jgi:CheY-like chemotaxis protein
MKIPKILLVDDVPLFLEIMSGYLRKSPVTLVTAHNGQQALEMIRSDPPDLIFMDLHMPEMDGAACCRAIKESPVLSRIPVIMVTAADREGDRELCLAAGCDGLITKPIDRRLFLDLGRRFLPSIDRREDRHPYRTTVVMTADFQTFYGTSVDISAHGIYVATDRPLPLEGRVGLNILLAGESSDLIEAWGRVAWRNFGPFRTKEELPEGYGVEFLEMTVDSLSLLSRLVRILATGAGGPGTGHEAR